MEISQLIEGLSDPGAYPHSEEAVEVRQTHISAVFLSGDYVYKIKKPVDYGFVDFSAPAIRRHYCEEEVRLNSRLAPDVYIGVVPVTRRGTRVEFEGNGETVEWAVKMRRLPDEATLQFQLRKGEVNAEVVEGLAQRIAAFHAQAESGPHIAKYGQFSTVSGNALENFERSSEQIGKLVSKAVFDRSLSLTRECLDRHQLLIDRRAQCNVPRDTHGDLRLDHVYWFPKQEAPANIIVIDCIEFNERYRFSDPVSDMAFLFMGFIAEDRRDLAQAFAHAYFSCSEDREGRALLPFYASYRAAVRAKVEGLKLQRPEMAECDHAVALTKAKGSWLLALGELEAPGRKPCLVLVGGLPGTGKSKLANGLAQEAGFRVIRSDVVRKELVGIRTECRSEFGEGIYTADWTKRTYEECLCRADELLFQGERVLVDANFREEQQRQAFLNLAKRWNVPATFVLCEADREIVRQRLASRSNDASDADWSVYEKAARAWEAMGRDTKARAQTIATGRPWEFVLRDALSVIRNQGLAD